MNIPMKMNPYQQAVIDGLEASGIDYFLHVPGGPLAPIIDYFAHSEKVIELPLAREEEGIGVMGGLVLGGKRPVLMMQDNGLGNAQGVLATFAKAYHIPGLILSIKTLAVNETIKAESYSINIIGIPPFCDVSNCRSVPSIL